MFIFQTVSYSKQSPDNGKGLANLQYILQNTLMNMNPALFVELEKYSLPATPVLKFLKNEDGVKSFLGSVVFVSGDDNIGDIRCSIVSENKEACTFNISFRAISERSVKEGACTVVVGNGGSLTVNDTSGSEVPHTESSYYKVGKIYVPIKEYTVYETILSHNVDPHVIEVGSKYYDLLLSAVASVMETQPKIPEFGSEQTYPIHTRVLSAGNESRTFSVHDKNNNGKFDSGDKICVDFDNANGGKSNNEGFSLKDTITFTSSEKGGVVMSYEINNFVAGQLAILGRTPPDNSEKNSKVIMAFLKKLGESESPKKEDGF